MLNLYRLLLYFLLQYHHMLETAQPIIHDFTPSPIQEPPLKNNKSCLRRTLVGLFTLILIALIIFTILGLFINKQSVTRLQQLPGNFPTDVPLYNFNDRAYINYTNAAQSNGFWYRISLVPRFFLGSVVLKLNPDLTDEQKILNNNVHLGDSINWNNLKNLLTRQEKDAHVDKIEISWENLTDETPKKVYNYYKNNFTEQGYKIVLGSNTAAQKGFYFNKNDTSGELVMDIENKEKITQIILKVNFPSQEK